MQEQTTTEKTELKIPTTLKALVEALIFAAQEPLSISQIRAICQGDDLKNNGSLQVELETVNQCVKDLNSEYEKSGKPYRIVQIAGGFQFATLTEYADWLGRLYKEQGRRKLSQSGVETLSIVAYKQPITKAEIEKIRGVNCDYVLKTLLEKELLTVTGRAESVGRPLLYGTTKEFLKHFGLNDITDLPRPREVEEILGESQFETERRMLEAQEGAEMMKKEQEDFKSRLPHIPKKKSELEERNVEIIRSKKTQEIKINPIIEQKSSEEAGQESIIFNAEEIKQDDLTEISDNKNNELLEETEEKILEPEISQQPVDKADLEETIEISYSKQGPEISQETFENEIIDPGAEDNERNLIEGSEEQSVPEKSNRWKKWKEKIQVFIKKLFA